MTFFRPGSVLRKLDSSLQTNVRGFWNFENDLTDDSGNGFTLSLTSGTANYGVVNGLTAWMPQQGQLAERATPDALLQISGALTIHVLMLSSTGSAINSAEQRMVLCFDGGAKPGGNAQYDLNLVNTGGIINKLRYFAEYGGGGANEIVNLQTNVLPGAFHLYTLTRDATALDLNMYIDGDLVSNVAAANAPTGGATARVQRIGELPGFYAGLMICEEESSAATVLAQAQAVGVA
jgi:hypothetical protein